MFTLFSRAAWWIGEEILIGKLKSDTKYVPPPSTLVEIRKKFYF